MKVSLIVACDAKWGIGKNGNIPWHLPADFAYFKQKTLGHPIITGRKNFQDMGVLPGRHTFVITRDASFTVEDTRVTVVHSIEDAIRQIEDSYTTNEAFVVGGAEIYRQFIEAGLVDDVYITHIEGDAYNCDTFFPIDILKQDLVETSRVVCPADTKNNRDLVFSLYSRASSKDI
ncbi:MAG: dihydrofolate reductase [Patescibacteria group bacterium]